MGVNAITTISLTFTESVFIPKFRCRGYILCVSKFVLQVIRVWNTGFFCEVHSLGTAFVQHFPISCCSCQQLAVPPKSVIAGVFFRHQSLKCDCHFILLLLHQMPRIESMCQWGWQHVFLNFQGHSLLRLLFLSATANLVLPLRLGSIFFCYPLLLSLLFRLLPLFPDDC